MNLRCARLRDEMRTFERCSPLTVARPPFECLSSPQRSLRPPALLFHLSVHAINMNERTSSNALIDLGQDGLDEAVAVVMLPRALSVEGEAFLSPFASSGVEVSYDARVLQLDDEVVVFGHVTQDLTDGLP